MVDVFLTHTCTEDYNKWYRKRQVKELVDHVKVSDADFVALGGNFNVDSRMAENWYETIEDVIGHQLFSYLTFRICRDRHDGSVNSRQRCRGDWRRLGKSCRMICRFS